MKIVLQAVVASILLHLIYFVTTMIVSYVETINYKPNIAGAWNNVNVLQDEVVFGVIGSPIYGLLSFVVVAIICGIIIVLYKKILR